MTLITQFSVVCFCMFSYYINEIHKRILTYIKFLKLCIDNIKIINYQILLSWYFFFMDTY